MKDMACNFRSLMMTGLIIFLSIVLMLCSAGCGRQQQEQTEGVKELVATGSTVYVDGNQDTEAVQEQLELFVKNFDKWRIDGGKNESLEIGYAVTDLDHNDRLEIMALSYDWQEAEDDGYRLRKCFEVNPSGDGIREIETGQIQEVPLGYYADIGKLGTTYFDPETGEYHYVMTGVCCADDEDYDYDNIIALTMKDGQIIQTTLGTCERKGKEMQYFRVDAQGRTEIREDEYNVDKLGALSYPDCGKFDVWFSTFTFEHALEEHIYHAMEKAYGECYQGYPLEKQEKEIHSYPIAVPQYTTIQNPKKQKRINQMICEQVEQSLSNAYKLDSKFNLDYADITIKYAGRNRVSLLLEARGYHEGAAYANEHCDTINIDLKQEKILSGQDILPKQYQEEVEDYIECGDAEGFHGGEDYQKTLEENEADLFPTLRAKGWQDVKIYQTRDEVGVVIPTKFGLDAYVIYKTSCEWDWGMQYDEDERIHYSDVDWEAYQYKMLPPEYQSLQSYMPVLTGGNEITLIEEDWSEDEMEMKRKNLTISDLAREYTGEDLGNEEPALSYVCIFDLTQDGKAELILHFSYPGEWKLVLHKEGDAYYGIIYGRRSLQSLKKNGVYINGKGGLSFYQMRFEKDTFVESYIGGYEISWDSETEKEHIKYYVGEKEVEKGAYKKWEKSIAAEEVLWYAPEILAEKIEKSKSEH